MDAIAQSDVDAIVDDMTDTVQDALLRQGSDTWLHGNDDARIALERKTMIRFAHRIVETVRAYYTETRE